MKVPHRAIRVLLAVQDAPGDNAALAGARQGRVLNRMLHVKHHVRLGAGITLVNQHGAAFEQVKIAL